MRRQPILQFRFHAVAPEGAKRTGRVAQRNHKFVNVLYRAFHLFAGSQSHHRRGVFASRIKHPRLQLDGRVLAGDSREIAAGRVAIFAATGSVEIGFAGFSVAGEEFLHGIRLGDAGRFDSLGGTRVQEGGNVAHLIVRQRHGRHALVRAPLSNHFAKQVSLNVMGHQRRANQVRPANARGVRSVTESAGLLELPLTARSSGVPCIALRPRGRMQRSVPSEQKNDGGRQNYVRRDPISGSQLMPGHSHSSRAVSYIGSHALSIYSVPPLHLPPPPETAVTGATGGGIKKGLTMPSYVKYKINYILRYSASEASFYEHINAATNSPFHCFSWFEHRT